MDELMKCNNWTGIEIFLIIIWIIIWIMILTIIVGILAIGFKKIFIEGLAECKNCPESGIFWIVVGFTGSLFIYGALCHTKAEAADIAKIIVAYLSGAGLLFSYFYNKREERKINVHSEAHWRNRLFSLAQKKDLTYRDILYFLTFFNNNAKQGEQEDECDYKLLQAIKSIINSNGELSESQGHIINSVYNILYRGEENQISIYDSAKSIKGEYENKEGDADKKFFKSAEEAVNAIEEFKGKCNENIKKIKTIETYNKKQKKDSKELINVWKYILETLILLDSTSPSSEEKNSNVGKPDCCYILKELSISNAKLNDEQRAAFQLCIEFLLKADWNKQMNKEAGIKKSKNKKSKI